MQKLLAAVSFLGLASSALCLSQSYPESPEAVIRTFYDRITWKAGVANDWDKVREVFRPEAVFALRLTRNDITMLDLDGFIKEFVKFAELDVVKKHGFQEKILKLKATQYGDIANVYVHYETTIPGYAMPPQYGIDVCHLVKKDGKWAIVSIVNEVVAKDVALPPDLRD